MPFYADDEFVPDMSIGYLVRRAHQLGGAAMEPVFAAEGLSGIQWSALVSIHFQRGVTAADLARDLGHDKGAMTRLVDMLEERGWITRQRTPEDRRCVKLALTEEGIAVALRCKRNVIACWNRWLADWSETEVRTMIALLQKLRSTLAAAGEGPCA
jgi:DNA-binding MarR family transcriptional regulator